MDPSPPTSTSGDGDAMMDSMIEKIEKQKLSVGGIHAFREEMAKITSSFQKNKPAEKSKLRGVLGGTWHGEVERTPRTSEHSNVRRRAPGKPLRSASFGKNSATSKSLAAPAANGSRAASGTMLRRRSSSDANPLGEQQDPNRRPPSRSRSHKDQKSELKVESLVRHRHTRLLRSSEDRKKNKNSSNSSLDNSMSSAGSRGRSSLEYKAKNATSPPNADSTTPPRHPSDRKARRASLEHNLSANSLVSENSASKAPRRRKSKSEDLNGNRHSETSREADPASKHKGSGRRRSSQSPARHPPGSDHTNSKESDRSSKKKRAETSSTESQSPKSSTHEHEKAAKESGRNRETSPKRRGIRHSSRQQDVSDNKEDEPEINESKPDGATERYNRTLDKLRKNSSERRGRKPKDPEETGRVVRARTKGTGGTKKQKSKGVGNPKKDPEGTNDNVSVGSVEAQKKMMAFSNMSFVDAWEVQPKSMQPVLDTGRAEGLAAEEQQKQSRRRLKNDRSK